MEQNGPEKIFNILESLIFMEGFPDSSFGKESVFNAGPQFNSWVGKFCWRRDRLPTEVFWGFPCGSAGKKIQCRRPGFDPWVGKFPWRRERPLQYSGLENSIDCIVHGLAKSGTQLSDSLSLSSSWTFNFYTTKFTHFT